MTGKRRAGFVPPYVPEPDPLAVSTTIIEKVADKETRGLAITASLLAGAALGCAIVGTIHNYQQASQLDAQQARVEQVARDVAYLAQADERQAVTSELGGDIDPANLAEALATPCPTEDSENCVWLGGVNGSGDAFVTVEGHIFPLTSGLE